MKTKRLIATTLILALVLALLVGCNKLDVSTSSDGGVHFNPETAADVEKFVQKYPDTSELTLGTFGYTYSETLSPLTELSKLTKLSMWGTFDDYSSIAKLTQLRELELELGSLTDISFLESLT
jgi:hypothetical protein